MKHCSACGQENYDENRFCKSCGAALEAEPSSAERTEGAPPPAVEPAGDGIAPVTQTESTPAAGKKKKK